MAEDSLIPKDLSEMIGKEVVKSLTFEIEKGAIQKFAEAIEDTNPFYRDKEYATKSKYGGIITPPLMLSGLGLAELQGAQRTWPVGGRKRGILRYVDLEYLCPVKAGDTVTVTCILEDVQESESKLGHMLTLVNARAFINQKGEIVAKEKMAVSMY